MSTTYLRDADNGYSAGYVYGRTDNVSVEQAETLIARMEGADEALLFGSGMAAATGVFLALEKPTHIIASQVMYWGFRSWLRELGKYGHSVTFVETSDLDAVRAAVRPGETGLIWVETPSNPLWSISDIAAIAEIAHAADAILCVDSTVATPIFTRPLSLGADIVMHSATKYIGGHSDVLGGALVVGNPELFERLYFVQNATGAVMGPLESYLCSRGLKTLELRVREQCRTAQRLAEHLAGHSRVSRVFYPGLADHPGHELARRQMNGAFGAMVSFEVAGDYQAAKRMVESTKLFHLAVSLGAVESLIEQPAAMSHASYDRAERLAHGLSDGLVRLSVGLEAFDDLRADLDQALAVALG
jgi:cystathionine beta-lyase/cystathionine gamma-synthase